MGSRIPIGLFLTPYLQIYIISLNRFVYIRKEKCFYGKSNSDWFDSHSTYVPHNRASLNVTRVLVKLRLQEPSPLARHGSKSWDCQALSQLGIS